MPLALGMVVVTYQDAVMTHLPARMAMAAQIKAGEIPFLHPHQSCGQPLAGNPNFGTFFPDTVLFLLLPPAAAFGMRFALAALLAFVGARRWARAEGASPPAAEVAGYAFALSGVFVSAWRFYNTGLALALAPFVLAAVARVCRSSPGRVPRRAIAGVAVWSALELLSGEPVVALLTAMAVALRFAAHALGEDGDDRPAPARAAAAILAGAALALLIAAPQVAATGQSFRGSTRDVAPFSFASATGTSVHAARMLEQVTPFPFGRPDLTGPFGFHGHRFYDNHAPYLWTLHIGMGGPRPSPAPRPAAGPRRARLVDGGRVRRRALARASPAGGAGLVGSAVPGRPGAVSRQVVVPRRAVPGGAGRAGRVTPLRRRGVGSPPRRTGGADRRGRAGAPCQPSTCARRSPSLTFVISVAAAALVATTKGRPAALLPWTVAGSLALAHLPLVLAFVDRMPTAPPPLAGGRVYERVTADAHPVVPGPVEGRTRDFFRRATPELWAVAGGIGGIGYAFDRDPDGSYFDGDRVARKAIDDLPWPERAPELRRAGVRYVVTAEPLAAPYRRLRSRAAPCCTSWIRPLRPCASSPRRRTPATPAGSSPPAKAWRRMEATVELGDPGDAGLVAHVFPGVARVGGRGARAGRRRLWPSGRRAPSDRSPPRGGVVAGGPSRRRTGPRRARPVDHRGAGPGQ